MRRTIFYSLLACFLFIGLQPMAQVAISSSEATADGSAMLDVSATDRGVLIPRMSLTDRDAIASPALGLLVFITDDNRFYAFNGSGWEKVLAGADGGWDISGGNLFSTVSGNVGIGTAEPSAKLEIADAGSNTFQATETRLTLFSDGVSASPRISFVRSHSPILEDDTSASAVTQDNDILGRISFAGIRINASGGSVSGAGWIEMIQDGSPTSTGVAGQMRFVTSTGSGNRTERMVINPDGNIGIGTTSPALPLALEHDFGNSLGEHPLAQFTNHSNTGNAGLRITYRADGTTTTGAGIRSLTGKSLFLGTFSTQQAITILDNGNVGIGTDSPSDLLELNGKIFLSGTEPMINFLNNSGTSDRMIIRKNPGSFGEINVLSLHELRFRTNDTDRMIIEEDGDIDMQGNQVKSFRLENRTSDPASPAVGQMWLRTDL